MKIPSIDKLADTKRIRKAALAIVKAKTFKEGYSYSVTQGRLQGQYTCIRRSLATREIFEKLEDKGLVRLNTVPDDSAEMDDLKGDTYNREANPDIQESRMAREEKEFEEKVARDGVWGVVGEYRVSEDEEYEHADSCFGFVGDDWKDSGYDTDIMAATIAALKGAVETACPHCGRPRTGKKHKH
jgi:hypothetical protein